MLDVQVLSATVRLTPPALALVCAAILGMSIASDDEEAVRTVVNGLHDAWNRHDMKAFGALFSPDADFVNVAGDHWKGRDSIQVNHAFAHGAVPLEAAGVTLPKGVYGIFKACILHVKQVDVRFLRKDIAVAHVQTEALGDARTKNTRRSLLVMILTQEGGRWLIAVAQNTEINRPLS